MFLAPPEPTPGIRVLGRAGKMNTEQVSGLGSAAAASHSRFTCWRHAAGVARAHTWVGVRWAQYRMGQAGKPWFIRGLVKSGQMV